MMIFRKETTCTLATVDANLWFYKDTKLYLFNWLIYKSSTLSSNQKLIETYSRPDVAQTSLIGYKKSLDITTNEPIK